MLAYDYPAMGIFWSMLYFFIFFIWIMLLFRVFADLKDRGVIDQSEFDTAKAKVLS